MMTRVIVIVAMLLAACSDAPPTESELWTELGHEVADWQLDHLDDFHYIRTFRDETAQTTGWIQAAFYIGLSRWATATDESDYVDDLLDRAEDNEWKLGPRAWHADDHAIGQVYLYLAEHTDDAEIDEIVKVFDLVLSAPPRNSLEFDESADGDSEGNCQKRWCWCDALFMSPPTWALLSRVTGDRAYLDYALGEYWATKDFLYDQQYHLFYRDSRFFDSRTEHGNRAFWSRGNGWVFAGIPLLLEALPDPHPARGRLLEMYREMAATFRGLQHSSGYWASSLLDVGHDPVPETSGTGFIVYGLAWGVNRGVLSRSAYGDTVEKGWAALTRAVDEDGRLGWVQQVGNAPDDVLATDTQLYGVGAFLLAASEMIAWQ